MKKEMNNKGFSLVELIIVVAIMAVLIGVLAPTYLKYVETSKRTSDCTSIGAILDACEVLAIDPTSGWGGSETISYDANGTCSGASTQLDAIVSCNGTKLQSTGWGAMTITVTRGSDGSVTFSHNKSANYFATYSPALDGRFTAAAGTP